MPSKCLQKCLQNVNKINTKMHTQITTKLNTSMHRNLIVPNYISSWGATTLSITTFSIMTFHAKTLSTRSLDITKLPLCQMCRMYFLFCWVSLCWMSPCWVSLRQGLSLDNLVPYKAVDWTYSSVWNLVTTNLYKWFFFLINFLLTCFHILIVRTLAQFYNEI